MMSDKTKEYLKREVELTDKYLNKLRALRLDIHSLLEAQGDVHPLDLIKTMKSLNQVIRCLKRFNKQQRRTIKLEEELELKNK